MRHQEAGENQGKLINPEGYIIANNQEEFVRAIFFNTGLNSAQKIELLIELNDIISNKDLIFNSIFNELNNKNQLTKTNKELLIELFKIGYKAISQSIKDNTTYQSLASEAVRQLEKETGGIINTLGGLDPNQDISNNNNQRMAQQSESKPQMPEFDLDKYNVREKFNFNRKIIDFNEIPHDLKNSFLESNKLTLKQIINCK